MASTATPAPKRIEPAVVMTATFTGDKAREQAKDALTPDTKPEEVKGFEYEKAVCTQEIDSKTFARAYWKPTVSNVDGVFSLIESDPIGLLKDLNYGSGLYYNSLVREQIANENSGPAEAAKSFEKALAAFIKNRAANGKPISEDKARVLLTALMEQE